MTSSRGRLRGYKFSIPNCEEAEGMAGGVLVKNKDKQQKVGKGVRQSEGKRD